MRRFLFITLYLDGLGASYRCHWRNSTFVELTYTDILIADFFVVISVVFFSVGLCAMLEILLLFNLDLQNLVCFCIKLADSLPWIQTQDGKISF